MLMLLLTGVSSGTYDDGWTGLAFFMMTPMLFLVGVADVCVG